TSNYSRLSVMAQYYFHITPLFLVPPESFQPMPKVESGIVRLVPHKEKPIKIDNEKAFSKFITQAFSQRRKTLRNVLKDICSAQQLESIDINPSARAQSLTLQQFASIYTLISS
ncbi:SSU rRNA (adenine(1518)-N(6)/adenine(1519)-N(6))-dimethyltransferase, partial [hydrothermal vent metagenome]